MYECLDVVSIGATSRPSKQTDRKEGRQTDMKNTVLKPHVPGKKGGREEKKSLDPSGVNYSNYSPGNHTLYTAAWRRLDVIETNDLNSDN